MLLDSNNPMSEMFIIQSCARKRLVEARMALEGIQLGIFQHGIGHLHFFVRINGLGYTFHEEKMGIDTLFMREDQY